MTPSNKKSLSGALKTVQIVIAIVVGIIAILAFFGIKQASDLVPAQTPTQPQTPPQVVTDTSSAVPSLASKPMAPAPNIPAGYRLYDDFTAARPWQDAWWPDDSSQVCDVAVGESHLIFHCLNTSQTDSAVATLHARTEFDRTTGVAAVVKITKAGGALELVMNLACTTDNVRRAYHIAVDTHEARATEYFPQPGPEWPMNLLGSVTLNSDIEHVLQLERVGRTIKFWVDHQKVALQTQPDIPAC